jgi:hypothetical protein
LLSGDAGVLIGGITAVIEWRWFSIEGVPSYINSGYSQGYVPVPSSSSATAGAAAGAAKGANLMEHDEEDPIDPHGTA